MKRFITLLFLSFVQFLQPVLAASEDSVVKVFVTKSQPDYQLPWQTKRISQSSGSGVYVDVHGRQYILTSAHVVGNATFIEVRKNNNIRKYPAQIKWLSNETDLALLSVDEEAFFNDIEPLALGSLPKIGEEVTALGYPMGGDELSTTLGIVSRIEHRRYSYSGKSFLTIQIDTPINPGNSGGPIINQQQQIVGIAMQTITKANNISYLVPSRIIQHFFTDIADGRLHGMPAQNFAYSLLENQQLRDYYRLPASRSGILIEKPEHPAVPLQENDILLELEGVNIENDGTAFLSEGRLAFKELIHQQQIGKQIQAKVFRDGQVQSLQWPVQAEESNLPTFFATKPRYHLFGGLILAPLSQNIINALSRGSSRQNISKAAELEEYAKLHPEQKEIIVLQRILPNQQNAGYKTAYAIIESLNDKPVNSFKSLIDELSSSTESYIKFKTSDDQTIVLNKEVALQGDELIKVQYGI